MHGRYRHSRTDHSIQSFLSPVINHLIPKILQNTRSLIRQRIKFTCWVLETVKFEHLRDKTMFCSWCLTACSHYYFTLVPWLLEHCNDKLLYFAEIANSSVYCITLYLFHTLDKSHLIFYSSNSQDDTQNVPLCLMTYTIDAYIGRTSHLHCSLKFLFGSSPLPPKHNFGIVFFYDLLEVYSSMSGKKNIMNDIDKIANIDKIIWQIHVHLIFIIEKSSHLTASVGTTWNLRLDGMWVWYFNMMRMDWITLFSVSYTQYLWY